MKTRQLVFNNAENAKFAAENFVCVSASDVTYKTLAAEDKAKPEFRLLKKALEAAPNGIHQGIYVVTPSGEYLGKVDQGWPTYDTVAALRNMKKLSRTYQQLKKTERLAAKPLNESDRSFHRSGYGKAPKGTIELVSVTRGYAFEDMKLFDLRHEDYFTIDRLWYSPRELKSLIPEDKTVGEVTKADPLILRRLVQYNHFVVGGMPWNSETHKDLQLSSKVVKVKGSKLYLTMQGVLKTDSQSKYNAGKYAGKLLGRIIYDTKSESFDKFELVALGKHDLRKLASNVHRGNITETDVAMVLKLDRKKPSEKEINPAHIQYYPRHLKPVNFKDIKW